MPRACAVCERLLHGSDRRVVCAHCWARARRLPHPQCERCGHPERTGRCLWCDLLPPYVRAVRSVCWIPGVTAGSIVHALKYDGWSAVAEEMAAHMSRLSWPADVLRERGALVPIPLSPTRERERGFNQSALLARSLASRWGIPVVDALERGRVVASQTRLTPDQRRLNVAGAFRAVARARSELPGMHVVLVDDVVTTGATLAAAAAALLDGGARIVSAVTFGRAPAAGDLT
jgi:ComF family protein